MSNSSSNTTGKRWTRIAPGLFRDLNGTINQVKRKGRKVVWKRLEGISGNTKAKVMVEPLPEGQIEYPALPRCEPEVKQVHSPLPIRKTKGSMHASQLQSEAASPSNLARPPTTAASPSQSTSTIEDVVEEMLQVKAAKVSKGHLKDLEGRLARFAKEYGSRPISGITGPMLEDYIGRIAGAPRTRLNNLRHIQALLRFASRRGHLPKDAVDYLLSYVEPPENSQGEVAIFTSAKMHEIFAAARPEMIPFIAIGGFAGLRTAEIARLDWSKVDLEEKIITVDAAKSKTGSRRVVPVQPNLLAWLRPYAKDEGQVLPFVSWWNQLPAIAGGWKKNGLRHSFCSYRLAVLKDEAQVSYEAGNSPEMIQRHYKALVTEKQGKAWFNIVPS